MSIKQLGNLMKRFATLPAVLHQCFLTFGVTRSRSSGHLATFLLLAQSSVCCIDRLNPPFKADVNKITGPIEQVALMSLQGVEERRA